MVDVAEGQPQLQGMRMINLTANKHSPAPAEAFNQHISRSVPQAPASGWEGGSFPGGASPGLLRGACPGARKANTCRAQLSTHPAPRALSW